MGWACMEGEKGNGVGLSFGQKEGGIKKEKKKERKKERKIEELKERKKKIEIK